MNINPIGFYSILSNHNNKLNSKINNNRMVPFGNTDENKDKFVSHQNNDPDIIVDERLGIIAEKFSMEQRKNNEKLHNAVTEYVDKMQERSWFKHCYGIDPNKEAADLELFLDDTNIKIMSLEEDINKKYKRIPESIVDKLPDFVNYSSPDFIKQTVETHAKEAKEIAELKKSLHELDGTYVSENDEFSWDEEKSAQYEEALASKYGDRINELFRKQSAIDNYNISKILTASKQGNARRIIDIASDNDFVMIKPQIKDNNDGTSTYIYIKKSPVPNVLSYVKDNFNGDFRSFAVGAGKGISGIFRENGSLEGIVINDKFGNGQTQITPDKENKEIVVLTRKDSTYRMRIFCEDGDSFKLK